MPTSSSGSYFLMMASRIMPMPTAIISTLPHQNWARPVCAAIWPKKCSISSKNMIVLAPVQCVRRGGQ